MYIFYSRDRDLAQRIANGDMASQHDEKLWLYWGAARGKRAIKGIADHLIDNGATVVRAFRQTGAGLQTFEKLAVGIQKEV